MVRFDPFHCTVEVLTKFVPFTVRVKPTPPAMALVGEVVVIVGTGLLIVKVAGVGEVPPPGAGLTTVTEDVPADAMSVAGIVAVSCAAFTNTVVRFDPFHCTCEVLTKFEPFTVKIN